MLYPKIDSFIQAIHTQHIPTERQNLLSELVSFIQAKREQETLINLNFICTHNSRRSHLSQIWAQTMAYFFNIPQVVCYSGGTESTAMYSLAIQALESCGFRFHRLSDAPNPVHAIRYSGITAPIIAFSKTYDSEFNAASFAAIMTCSHADENCPLVLGAEKRIPITYEDPKAFDGTPEALDKYKERSLQIATEMKWVFEQVKMGSK